MLNLKLYVLDAVGLSEFHLGKQKVAKDFYFDIKICVTCQNIKTVDVKVLRAIGQKD